ncbi:MAG TPA: VCBS repeat-containing protein [Fimbriiglobus sp.]|nr:VCBS repeat-containing protein [Fimbriiglobus sp.]
MADYDGDGRTDLLSGSTCCQDPWCFYLFRRKADGTFGPRETVVLDFPRTEFDGFEFSVNGLRSRVAVADWNGDGRPDLLVTGGPPGVAFGPLGAGKVTVKRLWPKATRDELNPRAQYLSTNPVLADWDGDGLLDLVGGSRLDTAGKPRLTEMPGVYWWRNVGTKTEPMLGPPRLLIRESNSAYATGLSVADWNADGKPDLIVAREERNGRDKNWSTRHHKVWVHLRRTK